MINFIFSRVFTYILAAASAALLGAAIYQYFSKASLQKDYDTLQRSVEVARIKLAEQRIEEANVAAQKDKEYADAKTILESRVDSLLVKLRDERARNKLKPVEARPPECGTYEATPSQLSEKDREFLVRQAALADEITEQLTKLQEYVAKITE